MECRQRTQIPEPSYSGITRSRRSVPCTSLRGHQSLRHPCEACHYHAEGYSASQAAQGSLGRPWVIAMNGELCTSNGRSVLEHSVMESPAYESIWITNDDMEFVSIEYCKHVKGEHTLL
jgi:hypothetical protein